MARDRYKVIEGGQPHFLTCTIVNWIPIFASKSCAEIVIDSLRFMQQKRRIIIYAWVLLENHLHLIASAENLAKQIANFKSYTAKNIIDYLSDKKATRVLAQLYDGRLDHRIDRPHQLWQQGAHPKLMFDVDVMKQKIEYIHQNPVKRGYVDEAVQWRHSSARNYAGVDGLIYVEMEWA